MESKRTGSGWKDLSELVTLFRASPLSVPEVIFALSSSFISPDDFEASWPRSRSNQRRRVCSASRGPSFPRRAFNFQNSPPPSKRSSSRTTKTILERHRSTVISLRRVKTIDSRATRRVVDVGVDPPRIFISPLGRTV